MLLPDIKVLVVDDSVFMRKSLSIMLESDPEIKVIGTAKDGEEGINLALELKPDIITMDIEMPKMNGLMALQKIMKTCPTAVIMISSLTTEGAEATLKALEYGAMDFIPKELSYINVNIIKIKEELIRKVKELSRNFHRKRRFNLIPALTPPPPRLVTELALPKIIYKAIAIGVSTGGPLSLQKVIPALQKKNNVPVFIVQHMPPKFTKSLAERLDGLSELKVKEAENNENVIPGTVYLAPGGFHMTIKSSYPGSFQIDISENPQGYLHRPSVDVMLESLVNVYGKSLIGIIMTGMGKDGLEGVKKLKNAGGRCIAQNEETCVVYGMPRAVIDAGLAEVIAPLDKISEIINKAF